MNMPAVFPIVPRLLAGIVLLGLSVTSAPAATLDIEYLGKDDGRRLFYQLNGTDGMARPGRNRLRDSATGAEFATWNLDIFNWVPRSAAYMSNPGRVQGVQLAYLDRLFSTFSGRVNNKLTAAAFQASIWEIMKDDTLDLSGGNFMLTAATPDRIRARAERYLARIQTPGAGQSGLVSLGFLDARNQARDIDQIVAGFNLAGTPGLRISRPPVPPAPVPLPAGGVLLATAVAGMIGLGRWRRRQAQAQAV